MDWISLLPIDKGIDWIETLFRQIKKMQAQRQLDLDNIKKVLLMIDPLDLVRYYVEPYCQDVNPANRFEEDQDSAKELIFKERLAKFLQNQRPLQLPGSNVLFILSDAGMGKTALLAMIKLSHMFLSWPKVKHCELLKLGGDTTIKISEIQNGRETLLLLDALDEDPGAYGRVKERLLELLRKTQHFYRVIVTCRTQFFPLPNKEIDVHTHIESPGKITIGGFTCLAKYLSIFDPVQIDQYLRKRFPMKIWLFHWYNNKIKLQRAKARTVIEKMGYLSCRPMLLAYIDSLMEDDRFQRQELNNEYQIYKTLVDLWLERERSKGNPTPTEDLWTACKILATVMQRNNQQRLISIMELESLKKTESRVSPVETIDLTGRSLLNRTSEGEYRFSHYSIQEFLTVEQIHTDSSGIPAGKIPHTDFILKLLLRLRGFCST